jgi:U3 small nucleolar RNA-associated protein MPP10
MGGVCISCLLDRVYVMPIKVFKHKRGREASLLAEEELTSDDRKRLRRASKSVRRKENHRKAAEEKLVAKINPGLGNKHEAAKALREIRGDKRVVDAKTMRQETDDQVKTFTKSSKFFSALQKQTEEEVQRKKAGLKGPARGKEVDRNNSSNSLSIKL